MKIQVIGLDWKWLFIYPELGIATVGEVAFPVAEPVDFELTSDTVMQSFIISALAGQIYVMPGMTTAVNVEARQAGIFEGENMQYNGTGFAEQKFRALAMSRADFTAWVEKVRSQGSILDAKTFETLSQLSTKVQAQAAIGAPALPGGTIYFSSAPADLFASVRNQYHSGHAQAIAQPPARAFDTSGHSGAGHTLSP
jgi:cytochrome o ubiquinol oxidase subunit 2